MNDTDNAKLSTSLQEAGATDAGANKKNSDSPQEPIERNGPKGPEPTRFGDWESNGRCTDF